MEADSLGRDDLHERASLDTGENLSIDLLRVLFLAEDEAGAGAAEALVRGRGDEVGEGDGVLMDSACNEARYVGHVNEQEGTNGVGDLTESCEVDLTRVGGGACRDHPGTDFLGLPGERVIIDASISLGNTVMGH